MNSLKNLAFFLLAAVALGAAALAWKEWAELTALRATAVTVDERAGLQKRVWDAERRVKELERQLTEAPGARPGGSSAPGQADRPAGGGGALAASLLARMNDPEAQRLMAEQVRRQIERRYAELFAKLNLPPDKLEQLKSLLADRQTAARDAFLTANDQGVTDPQDFQKLVESTQADIDGQIKAAIGDSGYAQLQEFNQTQAIQGVVGQLRNGLADTGSPLTADQSTQMTDLIRRTQPATASGAPAGSAQVTDATIAGAQGVLSAPQVQALQEVQRQQQAQQRWRQIMSQGGGPR